VQNDNVVVLNQDGVEASHDAFVGADGIKNRVREALLRENDPAANFLKDGKITYPTGIDPG